LHVLYKNNNNDKSQIYTLEHINTNENANENENANANANENTNANANHNHNNINNHIKHELAITTLFLNDYELFPMFYDYYKK